MPEVTLRPVAPGDDAFVFDVFVASHPEYDRLPVSGEQKQFLIRTQYQMQTADYHARYPGSAHDIIEVDGEPIGRIWVARFEDHINVLDVGVLSSVRSKGIGTLVIDRIKAEAAAAGKPIKSAVLRTNEGSIRWQVRMGFQTVSLDDFHVYMEWQPPARSAHPS